MSEPIENWKDHVNSGVETNKRLRCLQPILQKWIALNNTIADEWSAEGDAPWWYNERAHVSVFAGAVWKTRNKALEEYSEKKKGKSGDASGRIDLWFDAGKIDFLAEFKQCWLPASMKEDRTTQVEAFMDDAIDDVRKIHPYGIRRLAIVFGVPYVTRHRKADIDDYVKWLAGQAVDIRANLECGAVAWTFPALRRLPTIGGHVYPGIIIWIKEIQR